MKNKNHGGHGVHRVLIRKSSFLRVLRGKILGAKLKSDFLAFSLSSHKFRLKYGEQGGQDGQADQGAGKHGNGNEQPQIGKHIETGKEQHGETRSHGYRVNDNRLAGTDKGTPQKITLAV